jgi:putative ABC transport system substrate-binding protein
MTRTYKSGIFLLRVFLIGALLWVPADRADAETQVARIGYLTHPPLAQFADLNKIFVEELKNLGWTEGGNLTIEWRSIDSDEQRIPELLAELIALELDVIVTVTTPITLAAKKADTKMPFVFVFVSDPLESKIIQSIARPGGNITGVSQMDTELCGKRVQLLTEVMPKLKRLGVLLNPNVPYVPKMLKITRRAAETVNLEVFLFEATSSKDLSPAFKAMSEKSVEAFVQLPHAMFWAHREEVVRLANQYRLPSVYEATEFVTIGGLMAYAENFPAHIRRAAAYVDQILRGTKPASLPVSQPMEFELAINLRTAQNLNLNIPESVLVLADQIIE